MCYRMRVSRLRDASERQDKWARLADWLSAKSLRVSGDVLAGRYWSLWLWRVRMRKYRNTLARAKRTRVQVAVLHKHDAPAPLRTASRCGAILEGPEPPPRRGRVHATSLPPEASAVPPKLSAWLEEQRAAACAAHDLHQDPSASRKGTHHLAASQGPAAGNVGRAGPRAEALARAEAVHYA